jgi:hypothetical protein
MKESWHHWVKDFPLWRESVYASCPFCPPLVVSRGQEKGTLKRINEKNARWLSVHDK